MRISKKNYKALADCRGMYEQEIVETIMNQRGIKDVKHFLNPTEDDLLPLDSFTNIDKAMQIVMEAATNGDKIGVFWDTDTDGITSGAIMTRYLWNFTEKECISTYINEGKKHGLEHQKLEKFKDLDVLIVVDSLDSNVSYYKVLCKKYDVKVVVLDHHAIKPDIPYDDYVTLVSSQRDYENKSLSGAGVTWKFCKYIDSYCGTDYADELVDLAACGIVADMMDMTVPENRYIVSMGLEEIYNPAIKKIIGSYEFNSTAIAFSVAPIINAANRMGYNEIAMKAFLADDKNEINKYIRELKKCKTKQGEEVDHLLPDVVVQCDEQLENNMIVAFIDSPYGVAGLLANKLVEVYQRPILVLKDIGDVYAGSMRAKGVADFRKMVNDTGLAEANGHELASGITIPKENFSLFCDEIEGSLTELNPDTTVVADVQLDISDITRKLIDEIKKIDYLSGTGFKSVRVYVNGMTDYEIGQMSDYKHLVVKPSPYLWVIKWNFNGSFEDMEDSSLMEDEIEFVATLDSGFLGRTFVLKAVCDEIEVVE